MPIGTQIKVLRALRQILLGDGRGALAGGSAPKPDFPTGKHSVPLPRCAPEAAGLCSAMLEAFYREMAATPGANAHSLLVARRGQVVAEGYFAPFRQDVWHVTHSLCKSVLGLAVGMAIDEGLFALDDRVADYFPEEAGLLTPRAVRGITVRHLLTMTSGMSYNEASEAVDNNWLRGIFASAPAFEPGSRFVYNSMNSYLLSALVCRTSGGSLMDYLTPRLFEPMGFGPVAWETSPDGFEKGGWGMYMMAEDMLKLGLLILQKGRWDTGGEARQLVPEAWVAEATRLQILSDAGEGYGFHLWLDSADGNVIMSGMFGQYVTVMPRLGLVIAMTAGNAHMFTDSPAYQLMRRYFDRLETPPDRLPPDGTAHDRLMNTLGALRYRRPLPPGGAPPMNPDGAGRPEGVPPEVDAFCGTTWHFEPNRGSLLPVTVQIMDNNFTPGVQSIRLEREGDRLVLHWEEKSGVARLPAGFGHPLSGRLRVGRESFIVACLAELRHNEDDEPVLLVEMCLLEHSSSRLLKLDMAQGRLRLRLDEQPQFSVALQSILEQDAATTGTGAQKANPFALRRQNRDYLNYRIAQLCAPEMLGTPDAP